MNIFIYKQMLIIIIVNFLCFQFDHSVWYHLNIFVIFIINTVWLSLNILAWYIYISYTHWYVWDIFCINIPRHVWTTVRFDKMTISLFLFCCQYQLVFTFIILKHSDLNTSSPYSLTCPYVVVLSCSQDGSETYVRM